LFEEFVHDRKVVGDEGIERQHVLLFLAEFDAVSEILNDFAN